MEDVTAPTLRTAARAHMHMHGHVAAQRGLMGGGTQSPRRSESPRHLAQKTVRGKYHFCFFSTLFFDIFKPFFGNFFKFFVKFSSIY